MPFPQGRKFQGRSDKTKYGKRHQPGVMNKTEAEYAEVLNSRVLLGDVLGWEFEALTFKLAGDLRYTPDFLVWHADGRLELVDSKGGGPIDPKSLVKIKVAAEKFPLFLFSMEQKLAKKHGGGWKRREF